MQLIGFDRPLKPEWIYKTLFILQPGEKSSFYNEPFENIAQELVGKEGKRKVRTVLFRSFVYSMQHQKNTIESNMFLDWVKIHDLDYLKPLFLSKILMDYDVTRFITQKIDLSLEHNEKFSSNIILKKMVQEYGDRDIVKRSVRSFLRTLEYFGLIKQLEPQKFALLPKVTLTDEQVRDFFLLYAKYFLNSKSIDLTHTHLELLYFFNRFDLKDVAQKYHLINWEYIRDSDRSFLMLIDA
jgi:hypothetical protein